MLWYLIELWLVWVGEWEFVCAEVLLLCNLFFSWDSQLYGWMDRIHAFMVWWIGWRCLKEIPPDAGLLWWGTAESWEEEMQRFTFLCGDDTHIPKIHRPVAWMVKMMEWRKNKVHGENQIKSLRKISTSSHLTSFSHSFILCRFFDGVVDIMVLWWCILVRWMVRVRIVRASNRNYAWMNENEWMCEWVGVRGWL